MKKILALILALVMALSLVACGGVLRIVDQCHRPDSPVNQTAGSRLGS